MTVVPIRWAGEADRYLGPFTYVRERSGYRTLAVVLGSGDNDDYPGCRLRLSAFGRTLIIALPALIRPWREKVYPGSAWDDATVARLGRDWYWNVHEREFGFTLAEGHLSVKLGRQTHDGSTTQSWGYFLPWTQWRHVRHSWYGLRGEHVADMPHRRTFAGISIEEHRAYWAEQEQIEALVPTATFAFLDYDGEQLTAATRINEREWRRGTGWFRWLSLIWPKNVRRSLDIRFSGETGKRKGSWKGGTIGTGIDMLPCELHASAFRRYCNENGMTFVGEAA